MIRAGRVIELGRSSRCGARQCHGENYASMQSLHCRNILVVASLPVTRFNSAAAQYGAGSWDSSTETILVFGPGSPKFRKIIQLGMTSIPECYLYMTGKNKANFCITVDPLIKPAGQNMGGRNAFFLKIYYSCRRRGYFIARRVYLTWLI